MKPLQLGSGGEEVRELQQLLQSLRYEPGPIDGRFGPKTEQAVRSFQGNNGLLIDGIAGDFTWDVLLKSMSLPNKSPDTKKFIPPPAPPPNPNTPHGYDGIRAAYGDFEYSSNTSGRIVVDTRWKRQNIVSIFLHTGTRIWGHRLIADKLKDIYQEACEVSGYTPRRVGCFSPRHKMWDVSKDLSLHSWGIAIDIDPSLNPYGAVTSRVTQDAQSFQFIEVFEAAGWVWGGRWKNLDGMHIQWAAGV